MIKKNKLKRIVKSVQGYKIRHSLTSGFAIYAGKNLIEDNIETVDEASEKCLTIKR